MVYDYFDKYTFKAEMYIEESDMIKEYVLNFFPFDNSVQVLDVARGTQLLRRSQCPDVKVEMLQVGNIVNVFQKLLLIKDCSEFTKKTFYKGTTSTFTMLKPMSQKDYGKILSFISQRGFRIVQAKLCRLNVELIKKIYALVPMHILQELSLYMLSGNILALELSAPNAVDYFRDCLGCTDPAKALPGTLRAMFATDTMKNCAHGAASQEEVKEVVEGFFGMTNGVHNIPFTATLENCTCCIIKPHAVTDGNFGGIIEMITKSGKFFISALASFRVNLTNADEFYEVYKGVYSHYQAMVIQLTEGICIAMEIKAVDPKNNETIVEDFRKLCGPYDPEVCRQLYPASIRASYGKDVVHNAVHCTDLPEDGVPEVEYFFWFLTNIHK